MDGRRTAILAEAIVGPTVAAVGIADIDTDTGTVAPPASKPVHDVHAEVGLGDGASGGSGARVVDDAGDKGEVATS
ncbi:MAG: hypothetical protein NVSMB53_16920 [Gemmatimonadaceae bacterium]